MAVIALTSAGTQRLVGDRWPLTVLVTDDDEHPVTETPVVTVTKPDGTGLAVSAEQVGPGRYRAVYDLAAPGRHTATVTAPGRGLAAFAITAVAIPADGGLPDVPAVNHYLGEHSWSDDDMRDALAAETAAQATRCYIPAVYPADLREALLRRVQRNLAMRPLSLAVLQGDVEAGGTTVLPGRDPEVDRFERPHFRWLAR